VRRFAAAIALACLASLQIVGCRGLGGSVGTDGKLQVESLAAQRPDGTPRVLRANDFHTRVYSHVPGGDTAIYASDIEQDELLAGNITNGQVIHVELLWTPKPGSTPMDSTATNISIHYVIFAEGELGVYSGAGFARPSSLPGEERLAISIRDSTLRLVASTPDFDDMLGVSRLTGTLSVELDNRSSDRVYRAVSQIVTNRLGQPTWF